jgi:hypothetical protein
MGGGLVPVLVATGFIWIWRSKQVSLPEDRHQAPPSTPRLPLSLQDGEPSITLLSVKYHQDEGVSIPVFDC